jgi:anthranilate synthase component 1
MLRLYSSPPSLIQQLKPMILPEFSQFCALSQQGNFVPVYQEWVADLETPVSAWYKVCAGQPYSFLLESVEGGENVGRYSLLGCDPLWVLVARGDRTTQTHRNGTVTEFEGNPFETLTHCLSPYHPVKLPQLPPGIGGLFGFWGYELIRWIEPRVPVYSPSEQDLPDGLWMQVDNLIIFDQVKRKIWAIRLRGFAGSEWRLGIRLSASLRSRQDIGTEAATPLIKSGYGFGMDAARNH